MKKVIALNGSRRKANTYGLLLAVSKVLEKSNIEVEIINLYEYSVQDCLGCEVCLKKDYCVVQDDMEMLMQKLIASDGVILGSPVYMGNVSGKMKTFMDRTCKWFHRPELVAKPALIVSTTAASALDYTMNYMQEVAIQWGLHPVGKVGRQYKNMQQAVTDEECRAFIEHLNKPRQEYTPRLKQLISYQVQKVLALKILEIDRQYWEKQGWDQKIYYYKCRTGMIKRLIAGQFYRMLFRKIKKI